MAQLPIDPVPQTPISDDPTKDAIWKRWFDSLIRRLKLPGQIDHNTLLNLQGGTTDQYYHLTSAQHSAITSVAQSRLLGRGASSGTGAAEAITLGTNLSLSGTTLNASGGTDLLIVYNDEDLTIPTNTQVTGHADLVFQGTGDLTIEGTGSLEIVGGDTTGTSGLEAASQSEMEAGTSVTVATTPGRQQYHQSAAKGWVKAGTSGNIVASYNVSSVTDTGTGLIAVNWATDFSSADYCAVSSALNPLANTSRYTRIYGTQAAGSVNVVFEVSNSGAAEDPDNYFVAAFGDQ